MTRLATSMRRTPTLLLAGYLVLASAQAAGAPGVQDCAPALVALVGKPAGADKGGQFLTGVAASASAGFGKGRHPGSLARPASLP